MLTYSLSSITFQATLALALLAVPAAAQSDCNGNGVRDADDIANGTSLDCNLDGIPDECAACAPVDVVFVVDTSASMNDESVVLCNTIQEVVANLGAIGVQINPSYLRIRNVGGTFSCLTNSVASLLGTTVPGGASCCLTLGNEEDWASATAIVAQHFPWTPGAVRVVVPISDEGPKDGDPCFDPGNDRNSITNAILVANANQVIVSPIAGTGAASQMPCIITLGMDLASATGGTHFISTQPAADLAAAIEALVVDACASTTDCNGNHVPDECDIASGTSSDNNANGVPDECETECLAVIGTAPGSSSLPALNHVFTVQTSHVTSYHAVLQEDPHEMVLPPLVPIDGITRPMLYARPVWRFTVQVVMWNPNAYPSNPEQVSHSLLVMVLADGQVISRKFGGGTGMTVRSELGVNPQGQRVVRFPFTIP